MAWKNGQWVEDDPNAAYPGADTGEANANTPQFLQTPTDLNRQPANDPAPSSAPAAAPAFTGFTPETAFTADLNELSRTTGQSRDALADQRDAYVQPLLASYRAKVGIGSGRAAADDATLTADPNFLTYARSGGTAVPTFATNTPTPNTAPQFTDPAQRLVESTALNRLQQLNNPEAGSGQQLFETFAKQLVDRLTGPAYSPADEAVIKAQAFNAIEEDRAAAMQRMREELSKRRIVPSSGVAIQAFRSVDDHYNKLRAATTNQLAMKAIDLTRANQLQALDVLGGLAGTQNARLDKALTVSRVPYDLGTDAFNQLNTAVAAGGNPQQNIQTAIQLITAIQSAQNLSSQQRAAYLQQVFATIGGLFA